MIGFWIPERGAFEAAGSGVVEGAAADGGCGCGVIESKRVAPGSAEEVRELGLALVCGGIFYCQGGGMGGWWLADE